MIDTTSGRSASDSQNLADLYPPIEPYETGVLPVSDGHRLVYELCGNPEGRLVVFLHGGPGAIAKMLN